jgi:hypothetical protein
VRRFLRFFEKKIGGFSSISSGNTVHKEGKPLSKVAGWFSLSVGKRSA